jgi:hypothetical protein
MVRKNQSKGHIAYYVSTEKTARGKPQFSYEYFEHNNEVYRAPLNGYIEPGSGYRSGARSHAKKSQWGQVKKQQSAWGRFF